MATIRLSKNFVYDVVAHFSVHDVVALNTYSSDRNVVGFQLNGASDSMMLDGLPGIASWIASSPGPRVPKISNFHFDPPLIGMSGLTKLVFDYEDDDGDMDRIHVVITYPNRTYYYYNDRGEWQMTWAGRTSGTAKYTLRSHYFTTEEVHTFTIQLIDRKGNISNSLQADVNVLGLQRFYETLSQNTPTWTGMNAEWRETCPSRRLRS